MNQILYIEPSKKEKKHSKGKIIFILFIICAIIIEGILIGKVVIGLQKAKEVENASDPSVTDEQEGNELTISIKHDKPIEKILYKWPNTQEIEIPAEGKQEITQTINVPVGTNELTLKVTDSIGKTVTYSKEYTGKEGDAKNPEIALTVEGQKIKIIAKDETALDYIIYYWNEEDGTRVDVTSEDTKQIEESVDILKGENTLKVEAVDKAGNTKEIEQTYRGSTKPKISANPEGTDLVIKISDAQGIQKIEYTLNGTLYSSDPQGTGAPLGRTELEIKQPLAEGRNEIYIKVYNVDNLEAEFTWEGTSNQ